MTYSVRFRVPMPIAAYDAMHAVVKEIAGGDNGMLAHLAWETADGFEILEAWQSRDAYLRFVADVWPQVVQRLGMGETPAPEGEEFELRGLVLPGTTPVFV
ncbi:hypothetical protein [Nakamurella deserti]|uniref:hypothetical protein n=1 Tax=Nakamurella deserti TaxID=2164074 RepID=UPI000DBE6ED2|nr:hypothetical protein [Nakamurella deserti]